MRFRRIRRRWWVLIGLLIAAFIYAAWPGSSTFTISPETTYVTEPVDADGYIDYPTALNRRLSEGVTPANNANVLIVQALGPKPEGAKLPAEFWEWLGIAEPAESGDYFVGRKEYFAEHLRNAPPDDTLIWTLQTWTDRVEAAKKWPWKSSERPDVAKWLRHNERPLALFAEACKRARYFNPLAANNVPPHAPRLINSLCPTTQKCREVCAALICSAMSRVSEGRVELAWSDLMLCHQIGRLIGSGGTAIELLVGIAVTRMAAQAQIIVLSSASISSRQASQWLRELQELPPMPGITERIDTTDRFTVLEALSSMIRYGQDAIAALDKSLGPRLAEKSPPSRLFSRSVNWDFAFREVNRTYDRFVLASRIADRLSRVEEYAEIIREIKNTRVMLDEMSPLTPLSWNENERGEHLGKVVVTTLVPAFDKIHLAHDQAIQCLQNLHLALALAAYRADAGRYPEGLDELAPKYLPAIAGDLFSGRPLIYRRSESGYLLYSVGPNEQDDGGHTKDDDPKGDDLTIRMPVPPPATKKLDDAQ